MKKIVTLLLIIFVTSCLTIPYNVKTRNYKIKNTKQNRILKKDADKFKCFKIK